MKLTGHIMEKTTQIISQIFIRAILYPNRRTLKWFDLPIAGENVNRHVMCTIRLAVNYYKLDRQHQNDKSFQNQARFKRSF